MLLAVQVYEDYEHIPEFECPYIPGFLAYREVPYYSGEECMKAAKL